MKKIVRFTLVILLTFFITFKVNAEIKECTYELSYTIDDKTGETLKDQVTFYLNPGVGIEDEFYIKSSGDKKTFKTTLGVPNGKIFKDKNFYIASKETIQNAFYGADDKIVKSCPSSLAYIVFGEGGALFPNGYMLCNSNYNKGADGVLRFGTITQVKNEESKSEEDKKNERKNCGSSFVFSFYSTKDASKYKGFSLLGQYYIENNTKYIEIKLKKGTEEKDSVTQALMPNAGEVLEVDFFKVNYGGLPIKVETFDICDNMPTTKTCEVFDSTTKIFIGSNCTNDANGDPDTEKDTETKEDYENNYENNYGSFDGDLPAPGFGEGGELCSDILGENMGKLVKLSIMVLRIVGAVIAIVYGMIAMIPAVVSKDPEAIKKAGKKCMWMGVILLIIGVFPTILKVIAGLFDYDISCIF